MRRTALLSTAAVVAALASAVPASAMPSAPRAAAATPVLTSLSLSTGAVSVRGLDTAPVTITATATGVTGSCSDDVGEAMFSRSNNHWWDGSGPAWLGGRAECVSDSDGVRTYRAVVAVPSSADGNWVFDALFLDHALDPSALGLPHPRLVVTGKHRPRLRFVLTPQPLPYPRRTVSMTVQATFDDTGAPVAGQPIDVTYGFVIFGRATTCPGCSGTTDAKGRLVRTVTVADHRQLVARMPIQVPGFNAWSPAYSIVIRDVVVQPALTASPAKSSVPHGTNVGVFGQAFGIGLKDWAFKPRADLVLQRLVGRHWRTVSWSGVRPTGRFTVVATPPKGRNLYRVFMGSQHDFGPGTSRTFVIRGT